MTKINLAFSPCPNDTFIFDAMVHHKIDTEGIEFEFTMADVEELNRNAFSGLHEMSKLSFHAWLYLKDKYQLLQAGSALGFGNGPLVISKSLFPISELENKTVATPGEFTTASLLFKFLVPGHTKIQNLVFNEIESAVLNDVVEAGVIIHENRFTYHQKGLKKICDLGEFWEGETGCPIPLGGICVRKDLGEEMIQKLDRIMHRSVQYALNNPKSSSKFVKENAQEMEDAVINKHIELYVNEFTLDLGDAGWKAIRKLMELPLK